MSIQWKINIYIFLKQKLLQKILFLLPTDYLIHLFITQ